MSSCNLQLRKAFYRYHLQLYSIPPSSLTPPFSDGVLQWPPFVMIPLRETWIPPQRSESITFISLSPYLSLFLALLFPWVTFCRRSTDSPVRSWENAPPFSAFNRFRGGTGEVINSLRARGKWREGKGVYMGWGSGWQVAIITRQMREEKQGQREERVHVIEWEKLEVFLHKSFWLVIANF